MLDPQVLRGSFMAWHDLFERPQLPRAPIARTTVMAACLVIAAAVVALQPATQLFAGAVRALVETVEVVLDSPRIDPSPTILASGAAGMPGGSLVSRGTVSGREPAVPQGEGVATRTDPGIVAVLGLLTAANLLGFGGRPPRRRDPPAHERHRLYRT
jgi:hypothetical protein